MRSDPSPLPNLDADVREVVRKGAVALVIKVFGAVGLFAFQLLLARWRGPSGVGVFYVALTIMLVASVLGRAGLDTAVVRFAAASSGRGAQEEAAGLYRRSMRICLFWSTIATAVLLASAGRLATDVFHQRLLVVPLRVMALAIVPTGTMMLHAQVLKGLKRTAPGVFIESVAVPVIALPLLFGARLLGVATETGASVVYLLGTCVAGLLAYGFLKRAHPWVTGTRGTFDRKLLIRTSRPLLVVAISDLMGSWSGILLLGVIRTSHDVGVFGITARTAALLSWVIASANSIAAPIFARYTPHTDADAMTIVTRRTARTATALIVPAFAVLVAAPHLVLRLFGRGFQAGAISLTILATAQLVNVVTGPVTTLLMMTGHERAVRNLSLASTGFAILLEVGLIPVLGVTGAAIGTAAGLVCEQVAASVVLYRALHVVVWPLPRSLGAKATATEPDSSLRTRLRRHAPGRR